MKIIKTVLRAMSVLAAYSLMFVLMFGAWQTLPAQGKPTTPDLSGKWTVHLLQSPKLTYGNAEIPDSIINLFVSTSTEAHSWSDLSGTYRSGSNDDFCPVKGGAEGKGFNLTVVCPDYIIELNGTIQEDTITGSYKFGKDSGTFKMERITCWVPEGCKQSSRAQSVSVRY